MPPHRKAFLRWQKFSLATKISNMIKYFIALFIASTLLGCKKDTQLVEITRKDARKVSCPKLDESYFLTLTNQSFRGELDGTCFSWSFGLSQFQGIAGYENGNGVCDSTDPVRMLLFGLTSEDGGQTRFWLYSPKYDVSSEGEFSNVFGLGKKKIGVLREDFYLAVKKDGKFYQSDRSNQSNEMEVLKTEEFTDDFNTKIRVWFKINARLSLQDVQNSNIVLANALMIAEFYGHRTNNKTSANIDLLQ